jgi:protein SCO1/2
MKKAKKEKTSISSKIGAFMMIILLVIGMDWLMSEFTGRKNSLPMLGEPGHSAGSFSFINQDGKSVTEKSVLNKVTVVEYFFTSCPSICPIMNRNLESTYDKFKNNPDFIILSHTVDPERDSVSVLKTYANRLNVDTPTWQFLTGDKEELYKTASKDYLLSAEDSGNSNFIHTQWVALLDRKRRIRGFYDATNKENILKLNSDIEQLLRID